MAHQGMIPAVRTVLTTLGVSEGVRSMLALKTARKESGSTEIDSNRTAATAPLFNYLAPSECADEKMVSQTFRQLEPNWPLAQATS
jgi:hypothetical protein